MPENKSQRAERQVEEETSAEASEGFFTALRKGLTTEAVFPFAGNGKGSTLETGLFCLWVLGEVALQQLDPTAPLDSPRFYLRTVGFTAIVSVIDGIIKNNETEKSYPWVRAVASGITRSWIVAFAGYQISSIPETFQNWQASLPKPVAEIPTVTAPPIETPVVEPSTVAVAEKYDGTAIRAAAEQFQNFLTQAQDAINNLAGEIGRGMGTAWSQSGEIKGAVTTAVALETSRRLSLGEKLRKLIFRS